MPAISVIIPSFNCAEFVCKAVDSVLSQTFQDYEILVIDDGSSDNTGSVLEQYFSEPRLRYIRQENRGLPGARNAGARLSQAEYLAFLDADDELAPNALELMKSALDSSGASWCLIDILKVKADGNEIRRTEIPSGNLFYGILQDDFICRGMFFRRQDFFDVGMYDESMRNREDWELNIRMFECGNSFSYIAEPLYLYSWREGSITTGNKPGMLHHTEKILHKHHKRLADNGDRVAASLYALNMWGLARNYFYRVKNYSRTLVCIKESLAYDPNPARFLHPLIHHIRRLKNLGGWKRSVKNSVAGV